MLEAPRNAPGHPNAPLQDALHPNLLDAGHQQYQDGEPQRQGAQDQILDGNRRAQLRT
jgi:hypothetical protein